MSTSMSTSGDDIELLVLVVTFTEGMAAVNVDIRTNRMIDIQARRRLTCTCTTLLAPRNPLFDLLRCRLWKVDLVRGGVVIERVPCLARGRRRGEA